jgi:DNA-binding Lrp family transcriptional regulator
MIKNDEKKILNILRENARKSIARISRETKIPPSTVLGRIARIEEYLQRYCSLVDWKEAGYNIIVHLAISGEEEILRSFLMGNMSVNTIQTVAKEYNFYVEAVFPDIKGMYDFLEELSTNNATKFVEHHILDTIKKESYNLKI